MYEADFKRNYLHVLDADEAFCFTIANFVTVKNQAYNVGLSQANLSKRELTEKIKLYVPDFYVHTSEIGSDPDKRNYVISNEKIESVGLSLSIQ